RGDCGSIMIRLGIFKQAPVRIPREQIEKLFNKIIAKEAASNAAGKINLIFVDDRSIRKLNKEFRKKDKSTDVLSFNIETPKHANATIGEIYISVGTARRQAREYNSRVNEVLLRLFCHGLLHLLGYDHIKSADRTKMEACERFYLESN
ncbi:MAG: rRNA maturation RNase YbeY, partial [Candidatus Zixiibacteriota bacterium]